MSRPTLDALGYFYAIQLEPDREPSRFKLGWTRILERRLTQHQKERRRPDARIVASWPCRFGWEQTIIAEATASRCSNVRGEEFLTDDPAALLLALAGYFERNDARSIEFPDDLLRQAFKYRPIRRRKPQARPESDFLLVSEAAARLGAKPDTIRGWLRSGRLRGNLLSARAGYRIPDSELRRMLTGQPPRE